MINLLVQNDMEINAHDYPI